MTDTATPEDATPELKIKIDGTEYPFPSFDTLSFKEARRIKKETGLVMGQFFAALEQGDPDALLAVALIAKLRDNPAFKVEDLFELHLDEIEIVTPPAAPVEVPDTSTPLAVSVPARSDGSDAKTSDASDSKETALSLS